MRIKQIRTVVRTQSYDGLRSNPRKRWTRKDALLIFVECDNGMVGIGEAWCEGGSPASIATIIETDMAPLLIGQDACAPELIWSRLFEPVNLSCRGAAAYAAISGIDIAIWDLMGKVCKQPLYRLLGGYTSKIPVYASGGMYGEAPEQLGERMANLVAAGALGVKIKVGGTSVEEDIERVKAVRAAIGPSPRLMLDALFVPDVPQAIRLSRAAEPYDIYFFEAPTALRNMDGWLEIKNRTGIPLAGTEVECGRDIHRRILEKGAVHVLQFDLTTCGGVTEGRKIGALAQAWYRPVSLHCSGTGVALAASLQFAGGLAGCDSVEMHEMHQALFDRLWACGHHLKDGFIHLSERCGLGIDLQADDLYPGAASGVGP